MEHGTKYDTGKPRIDLLSPESLWELGKVSSLGAEKYGERNWEKGIKYGRIISAAMRHILKYMTGETLDPETGIHHLAHAMWNCHAIIHFDCHKNIYRKFDDRQRHSLAMMFLSDKQYLHIGKKRKCKNGAFTELKHNMRWGLNHEGKTNRLRRH